MTTVIGELSPPELRFAAYELQARKVITTLAADKGIRKEFLRITGRPWWACRAGEPKVLVLCYLSSAQALRPRRLARLFRLCPNGRGGVAFLFP
jgi:hypothetical protein